MKKMIMTFVVASTLAIASCGSHTGTPSTVTDSTKTTVIASDSLHVDSAVTHAKDSTKSVKK